MAETVDTGGGSQAGRDGWAAAGDPFKTMSRVIMAVMLRESRTRYGDSPIGYLWAIVDPAIVMIIMVTIFAFIGRGSPTGSTLPVFILTGYMPFFLIRNCIGRGSTAASGNRALIQYPQVTVADIVIARSILEITTAIVVYGVLIVALYYVTDEPLSSWYDDPVGMIGAVLALMYFCLGSAVFSSSLGRVWPIWSNIWSYMSRPLFVLSGVLFTLENLPDTGRRLMTYNPIAHMIEWFRSVSLPGFESQAYSIFAVMATATVAMTIGLVIDRYLVITGDEEIVS